ncbi:Peroxidase 7 [Striga hermonthica]|uniref:peroxidase n=1 Tax=Striga hermonthica TaxID=68872 RepID=A0A9N7MZT9_STRHE|nr:Peroxidase 7 [Striga hermonthica]
MSTFALRSLLSDPFFTSGHVLPAGPAEPVGPMDWKETSAAHIFKFDLPGLAKQDVKLQIHDDRVLHVSADFRDGDYCQKSENYKWHCRERPAGGSFCREFRLPENALVDEIIAEKSSRNNLEKDMDEGLQVLRLHQRKVFMVNLWCDLPFPLQEMPREKNLEQKVVAQVSTVRQLPLSQVRRALPPAADLSPFYYLKTCPNLESIIQQKVSAWLKRDYTLAPAIIRLHFHDCAVRGCDASVLLNHSGSERSAEASATLRGFQLIDDIKAEVERRCPRTVSCADILTAAARDATVLAGGPFWEVPFGRTDGRISLAREADALVPQGHENVTALINLFEKELGLSYVDLVVLSGAHTIGRTSCHAINRRLFGRNGGPPMDAAYRSVLRGRCRNGYESFVDLDGTTPRKFDVAYYGNLGRRKGVLETDQLLYSDGRTAGMVGLMAGQPELFTGQFAVSMTKLGNVNVVTRRTGKGEVRLNCNYVNNSVYELTLLGSKEIKDEDAEQCNGHEWVACGLWLVDAWSIVNHPCVYLLYYVGPTPPWRRPPCAAPTLFSISVISPDVVPSLLGDCVGGLRRGFNDGGGATAAVSRWFCRLLPILLRRLLEFETGSCFWFVGFVVREWLGLKLCACLAQGSSSNLGSLVALVRLFLLRASDCISCVGVVQVPGCHSGCGGGCWFAGKERVLGL